MTSSPPSEASSFIVPPFLFDTTLDNTIILDMTFEDPNAPKPTNSEEPAINDDDNAADDAPTLDDAPTADGIIANLATDKRYYWPNILHPRWKGKMSSDEARLLSTIPVGELSADDQRREWADAQKIVSGDSSSKLKRGAYFPWKIRVVGALQAFRHGRGQAMVSGSIEAQPLAYQWYTGTKAGRHKAKLAPADVAYQRWQLDDILFGSFLAAGVSHELSHLLFGQDLIDTTGISGHDAWLKIEEAMVKQGHSVSAALQREMAAYRQGNKSVQKVADDFRRMFVNYAHANGRGLNESARVNYFLEAISHPSLRPFRTLMLHRMNGGREELTFEQVVGLAVQDEQLDFNMEYRQQYHRPKNEPQAHVASGNQGSRTDADKENQGGSNQRGRCNRCSGRGHVAKDCTVTTKGGNRGYAHAAVLDGWGPIDDSPSSYGRNRGGRGNRNRGRGYEQGDNRGAGPSNGNAMPAISPGSNAPQLMSMGSSLQESGLELDGNLPASGDGDSWASPDYLF